jgi:hypothetical protein
MLALEKSLLRLPVFFSASGSRGCLPWGLHFGMYVPLPQLGSGWPRRRADGDFDAAGGCVEMKVGVFAPPCA